MNILYNSVNRTKDKSSKEYSLDYYPHTQSIVPTVFSNDEVLSCFSRYKLPGDGSFLVEKMELRGRSPRQGKEDSRRLFLLGKDRVHYKILKWGDTGTIAEELGEDVSTS